VAKSRDALVTEKKHVLAPLGRTPGQFITQKPLHNPKVLILYPHIIPI